MADYIESLPDGYCSTVEDGGFNLSKGQKQLMTIARAMLSDAKMLILDEATSNVDTRTELKIRDAMLKLMEGRTCFVIAHRLSTIVDADLILVVKDGDVVERGKHAELLAKTAFTRKYTARNFRKKNGRQFVCRLSVSILPQLPINLSEFSSFTWYFVEKNFLPRRHSVFSFSGASVAVRRIRFPQLLRLFPRTAPAKYPQLRLK